MTWAPIELQKCIFETLSTDTALTTLIGSNKIFDHVPDNTAFPYVSMSIKPFSDRGNSTNQGFEATIQIDVWYQAGDASTGRGDLGTQLIQKRIDELLHLTNIGVDGWNVLLFIRTTIDIITDPDNVTKHGIQNFNILLGEK